VPESAKADFVLFLPRFQPAVASVLALRRNR